MKNWKRKLTVLCLLLGLLCVVTPLHTQAASKVKLNKTKLSLIVNEQYSLTVKNNAQTVNWRSSKPKVASITQDGVVTARKEGTTVITAKIGKKKATCKITVKEKPQLIKKTVICIGKKEQLQVTGTNKKITWKSSNKKVVSVNKKGRITGLKKGKATITAKVGSKTLSCKVVVKAATPIHTKSLTIGNTKLYGFGFYSDSVSVTIEDPEIATCMLFSPDTPEEGYGLDQDIFFYGHKNGTTNVIITNNCNSEIAIIKLTVVKPEDSSARQQLIDYLLTNGAIEPDAASKFVTKTTDTTISTLEYDGMDDCLSYYYTETTDFGKVKWILSPSFQTDSSHYIMITVSPNGSNEEHFITAKIDASSYAGETLTFENGWFGTVAESSLQPIANATSSNAFTAINALLQENVNITLKDLGFLKL